MFKDFSVLISGIHLVQQSGAISAILVEGICAKVFEMGEVWFWDFSNFNSWGSLAERNHSGNLVMGLVTGGILCEIILNLGHQF